MAAAPSRIWSVRLPVGDSRERLRTLLLDESLANAAFQPSSRLLDAERSNPRSSPVLIARAALFQYQTNFSVCVLAPIIRECRLAGPNLPDPFHQS